MQVFSTDDKSYTKIPFLNNIFRDFTRIRQYSEHHQAFYDYDEGAEYHHRKEWAEKTFNLTFDLIKDYVGKNDRILDVCCGTGWHLNQFLERGYSNLIGIDADPVQIDYARKKRPRIKFVNGFFGKKKFDVDCDCMIWFDSISRIPFHFRLFDAIDRSGAKFIVINSQETSNDLYRDPHYNLGKRGFMLLEKRTVTEDDKNVSGNDDFKPFGTIGMNRPPLDISGPKTRRLFRSVYLFMRV
jgi:SAM-dependent methyltransferase